MSGVPLEELQKYLFLLRDRDAANHLLRVSAGLDSLVMGEGQILAQVGGPTSGCRAVCLPHTFGISSESFPSPSLLEQHVLRPAVSSGMKSLCVTEHAWGRRLLISVTCLAGQGRPQLWREGPGFRASPERSLQGAGRVTVASCTSVGTGEHVMCRCRQLT